jgi:hypothetical protein
MYFQLNVLQTDIDIVVVSLCLVLLQIPNILVWSIFFLFHTKNWFTYCASHKMFVPDQNMILICKSTFCARTNVFGGTLNAIQFLV